MSNETKPLTADESYNLLVSQIHAPVFFSKLASTYGITPNSPQEAQELLLMAGKLRNANDQQVNKQASAPSFISEANHNLSQVLSANGYQNVDENLSIQKAASDAVTNPLIKEAAITLSNYLAQTVQN